MCIMVYYVTTVKEKIPRRQRSRAQCDRRAHRLGCVGRAGLYFVVCSLQAAAVAYG